MAIRDISIKAQRLAEGFNPQVFEQELKQYNSFLLEKYMFIGAVVNALKEKEKSVAEAVKKVDEVVKNTQIVRLSYTLFRSYKFMSSKDIALQKFAPHILTIVKTVHEKLAASRMYNHNNASTPEFLTDSDIQILGTRVAEVLDHLLAKVSGEPARQQIVKIIKAYLGESPVKPPVFREDVEVFTKKSNDAVMVEVPLENAQKYIVVGSSAKVIRKEGEPDVEVVIKLILVPVDEEE